MNLRTWWDAAADLLLGASCPGCQRPGSGICARCRTMLAARGVVVVAADFPLYSAGEYDELTARVIDAWKEHRAWALRDVLVDRLTRATARVLLEHDTTAGCHLVPIPSRAAAVRRRGMDVTAALARGAARRLSATGLDVRVWRGLRSSRGLQDQAGLTASQRQRNVSGRFRVQSRAPAGAMVVVDDVVTTGATLTEAVRALAAASTTVLGAAVVADTPRRYPQ